MKNIIFFIIGNSILNDILKEAKSFWNYEVIFFDDLNSFLNQNNKDFNVFLPWCKKYPGAKSLP